MKRSAARATGIFVVSILIAVFAVAPVAVAADDDVNLCHATNSDKNPYEQKTVPQSAIFNDGRIVERGHGTHTGGIFGASGSAQWGDIIPAFGLYGGLNVAAGQAWIDRGCEPPPKLKLVKVVDNTDGGTAAATAWTLHADGPTSISGQTGTSGAVLAGSYALSESRGPTGYTGSPWSCSPGLGATLSGASGQQSVTFSAAAVTDVTCTITNTFVPPLARLTLVKVVRGSNEPVSSWTLDATDGPTPFAEGTSGVSQGVAAGHYNLSESADLAGYSSPGWVCSNAHGFVQSVTIGTTDVTCTITNRLDPVVPVLAQLTLVKEVVNAFGEPADATAWTLHAAGPTSFGGTTPVANDVEAGDYILSESLSESGGPSGYTASPWDCGDAAMDGDTVTVGTTDVTCTITNTFVPQETQLVDLTLVKVVVGGNESVGAWTLGADGPTPFAEGPTGTHHAVAAGTYTLSESGPSGYTGSDWVCPGAGVSGDQGSQTVTIGSDVDAVTCTITNTFVSTQQPVGPVAATISPRITLKAAVVNDVGGTAEVSDFILTGSSMEVTHEEAVQDSAAMVASAVATSFSGVTGDAAITNAAIPVGTYFLSESALPSGYSASAWACTGGQLNGSAITVALGNTVECVITNTYSSTVVDSTDVPSADPASPPPAVLVVDKAAPRATTPAVTTPTAATPTVTTLAFTGADPVPLSLLALLALVLGVALTVAGRRQGSHWARE